jgi:transcriptional regulator with XRE-family HTH domain
MSTFGELLAEARGRESRTLRQLAEALGCKAGYICDIEKGRRKPFARERILKAADYLNTSPIPLLEAAGHEVEAALRQFYAAHENGEPVEDARRKVLQVLD